MLVILAKADPVSLQTECGHVQLAFRLEEKLQMHYRNIPQQQGQVLKGYTAKTVKA